MSRSFSSLSALLIVFTALQLLGCGSGSSSNRVLQSMTITPAAADAQTFPNGQVQFTAIGTFSKNPSPVPVPFTAPYSGTFTISDSSVATVVATNAGVLTAQCVPGGSGTVAVTAIASTNAATGTGMTSTAVQASAQLTCP